MITVHLDDGAVVRFQDGTSKQEIATAVAKYYAVAVPVEAAGDAPVSEAGDRSDPVSDELYWNMGDEAVRRRVLTGFQ